MGGQEIKMWTSYQIRALSIQNDDRIPNLASDFQSDNIWPLFGLKNSRKLAKSGILPIFEFFLFKNFEISVLPTDFILRNSFLNNFSL